MVKTAKLGSKTGRKMPVMYREIRIVRGDFRRHKSSGGGGGLMGNVIQERSYHFERVPFNYNRFKPRTVRFEGKQKCTVLFICG